MAKYLHLWQYKSDRMGEMITEPIERAHVVKMAMETFDGRLEQFYFCFGEHDGVAISDFPDDEHVLAFVMAISTEGRVEHVQTTRLLDATTIAAAKALAASI